MALGLDPHARQLLDFFGDRRLEDFQVRCVEFAAMVISRFEWFYQEWPWRLLTSHIADTEARRELFLAFLNEKPCCLDECVAQPLQESLRAAGGIDSCMESSFRSFLALLTWKLRASNMPLEGILAELKNAASKKKGKPCMERYVFTGVLHQARKAHLQRGRPDALKPSTATTLQAQGVPVMKRGRTNRLEGRAPLMRSWVMSRSRGSQDTAAYAWAQWRAMTRDEQEEALANAAVCNRDGDDTFAGDDALGDNGAVDELDWWNEVRR